MGTPLINQNNFILSIILKVSLSYIEKIVVKDRKKVKYFKLLKFFLTQALF
jgi:hypothetical protein